MQAETGIVEKCQVRARVAERHQAVRVVQQLRDCLCVAVEQLRGEHGLQVFSQRQIQHKVQGLHTELLRQFGHTVLLVFLVFLFCGLHHMHFVPFVVEQTERGGLGQFVFHTLSE